MTIVENKTTKILKYMLWGCLYLTLFMPLLVSSHFIFPFITLKTIYFRILVEVAILLYTLLALSSSYYRPKFNKLLWLIIAFGAVVLLTSFTGVNAYRSLWGTIERGEGFLFVSHLIVFTFILSQAFKTRKEWFAFLAGSLSVSLLVGFYALAQKYQLVNLKNSAGDRLASTLGNASYLGAYALGHFWLAVLLLTQRKEAIYRIILALVAVFEAYILFQTQTRGAMIAFFISLFVWLLAYLIKSKSIQVRKFTAVGAILLVFLISLIYFNKDSDWMKTGPFQRLTSIKKTSVTVESRLYTTDSSLKAFIDRPVLGYGWENYNIAFNKYFHQEIYRDAGSQIWFDRAHNTIFDIAIATGIIGLVIYLGIYFFAYYYLFSKLKRNRENIHTVFAIMGFLLAHFIQNIFVFDSLPTYLMLFSVFGFVCYLASEKDHYKAKETLEQKEVNYIALLIGLVFILYIVNNVNIRPAQANIAGIKGLIAFYGEDMDTAVKYFKTGIDMNTYQSMELRQKLAENIMLRNHPGTVPDQEKMAEYFELAIKELDINIANAPDDAQQYQYQMALLNAAAPQVEKMEYLNRVTLLGIEALKYSPTRPQIYFEMGRAYVNAQSVERGLAYFEKGVELVPKNMDARWNLLTAYAITKNVEKAEWEYNEMTKRGATENLEFLERAARLYSSAAVHELNLDIYQKMINLDPENIEYWKKLAATQKDLGQIKEAKTTANLMLQRFPDYTDETFKFINSL